MNGHRTDMTYFVSQDLSVFHNAIEQFKLEIGEEKIINEFISVSHVIGKPVPKPGEEELPPEPVAFFNCIIRFWTPITEEELKQLN